MIPGMCLAVALFFEARSEPIDSQIAIAQVIMNRVDDKRWPDTICGVVFENETRKNRCSFSFACDGKSDDPTKLTNIIEQRAWTSIQKVADDIINDNIDWTFEADHYLVKGTHVSWTKNMTTVGQIGKHVFYKSNKW